MATSGGWGCTTHWCCWLVAVLDNCQVVVLIHIMRVFLLGLLILVFTGDACEEWPFVEHAEEANPGSWGQTGR